MLSKTVLTGGGTTEEFFLTGSGGADGTFTNVSSLAGLSTLTTIAAGGVKAWASNLECSAKTAPGIGQGWEFALRADATATNLRCNIVNTGTTCASTAGTRVGLTASQLLTIRVTPIRAPASERLVCSFLLSFVQPDLVLPTPLPSATPTATATASQSPTATATATASRTPTPTATATTITICPTNADGTGRAQQGEDGESRPICAPTSTATPTASPTATSTGAATATATASATPTTILTPTRSPTPSPSPTVTVSNTPVASGTVPILVTRTPTPTPSPSVTATPNTMMPVELITSTIPSDGVSYFFAFAPNASATIGDVSIVMPIQGMATLTGSGFGQIKYIVANLTCVITPVPGTGKGWDVCLMIGPTNCSSLGFAIYNGNNSTSDTTDKDNVPIAATISMRFTPVNNPPPLTKAACGFEIRYLPTFLP